MVWQRLIPSNVGAKDQNGKDPFDGGRILGCHIISVISGDVKSPGADECKDNQQDDQFSKPKDLSKS